MVPTANRQSKLPDHVKAKILVEQKKQEALSAVANISISNASLTPPPKKVAAIKADQPPHSQLTLNELTSVLCKLDQARVLYVLKQLPPHQLAAALEQVLNPDVDTPENISTQKPNTQQPLDNNNRRAERSELEQDGKIIYNNLMCVTNCVIVDLSDSGCQVSVQSIIGIPNYFILQIGTIRRKRECKVVWQKQSTMGIKFID